MKNDPGFIDKSAYLCENCYLNVLYYIESNKNKKYCINQ